MDLDYASCLHPLNGKSKNLGLNNRGTNVIYHGLEYQSEDDIGSFNFYVGGFRKFK